MTLSLCLGHKGRLVSVCGLLSVCPQVCVCCFPKLKGQGTGITRYYTKKKSWKNPHQFLLCFLNFINLVWPVLKRCWRCFVYKDWKKQKSRKGSCFWKQQSRRGTFVLLSQRLFLEGLCSFSFLHSFSFSCHLKSTFLFLMLILKSSFGFFSVCLESSDILITFVHQGQLCCKGMCLKSLSERPFHLIQN